MDLNRLSTCTFPMRERPLNEALTIIAEAGYKRIDLLGRMPHFSLNSEEWNLDELEKLATSHSLEIANLGTYAGVGLASSDKEEQEMALAEMKATIDVAARFGARSIRVFRPKSEIDDPAQIDRIAPWLQQAADYAQNRNIFMGFENHGGPLCGNPEHCRTLCEKVGSPYFGVLYDPCNLMGAGTDYREALEIMRNHITHVHFKDGAVDQPGDLSTFRRTMLGEGQIDFGWIMEQLNEIGYDGHIATEYELPDPSPEEGLRIWYETYANM